MWTTYIMICQTRLKPEKNAERKHLPNRFPREHEKRWLCKNYSWCSMTVYPRRITETARKMKPRLCLGDLIWVEPVIQSKPNTWSAVNFIKKNQLISVSSKLESAMWSRDTGQWIPFFDRRQFIKTWMSNIKDVCRKLAYWSHCHTWRSWRTYGRMDGRWRHGIFLTMVLHACAPGAPLWIVTLITKQVPLLQGFF